MGRDCVDVGLCVTCVSCVLCMHLVEYLVDKFDA